jgi:DNA-directed RNA polymerase subunit beta
VEGPGRSASCRRARRALRQVRPLAEIFEEISPIEDFQQTMSLSFSEPEFYEPKYSSTSARNAT